MLLLMLCNGYKTTKRSERRQQEERDIENDGETRAPGAIEHWYSETLKMMEKLVPLEQLNTGIQRH